MPGLLPYVSLALLGLISIMQLCISLGVIGSSGMYGEDVISMLLMLSMLSMGSSSSVNNNFSKWSLNAVGDGVFPSFLLTKSPFQLIAFQIYLGSFVLISLFHLSLFRYHSLTLFVDDIADSWIF